MKPFYTYPITNVPVSIVQDYWSKLLESDLLAMRLCDVEEPTMIDVIEMIGQMQSSMYCVVSETGEMIAEFMLENFTGRSAQVHFSMSPTLTFKESIQVATDTTDQVLHKWEHPEGGPYLESIFGLTPVTNRGACIFVLKCGFQKIGVLPGGMRDRGRIVDGMITIKAS